MRRTRLSAQERACNAQRLDEVNAWLEQVDLSQWHVGHVVAIDGYVVGVMMTYLADSYTIIAMDAAKVAAVEAGVRA